MSRSNTPKDASESFDPHLIQYMGSAHALDRHTPSYMPSKIGPLLVWIDQYIATALANRPVFPLVFAQNTAPYSIGIVNQMRDALKPPLKSLELIHDYVSSQNAYKNILIYNREDTPVTSPVAEAGLTPGQVVSPHSGIVRMIDAQVQKLRLDPKFTEVYAKQFGILPIEKPAVPSAEYDPEATATREGDFIVIKARAPRNFRDAAYLEIRVDRHASEHGVGTGAMGHVDLLGSIASGTYIDHEPMPSKPCVWVYYVNYVDRHGNRLGIQSVCEVAVQAFVT